MSTVLNNHSLADFTTLKVGGIADKVVVVETQTELLDAVQAADLAGEPLLVMGGGSNVVVADDGWRGTVVLVRSRGIEVVSADSCGGAMVRVEAGHDWDDFVAETVERDWYGIEALSGIPGTVGAAPIQNVGAYGQDVSQTIARVRTYDRLNQRITTFNFADCQFGYRNSRFKAERGRHVILEVDFQLRFGPHSAPVQYRELADKLGVELGARADIRAVREAVLELRTAKGMVIDPVDHDCWSVGSFFTNPVVAAELADRLPLGSPAWPQPDGLVKLSAAWLVEQSGHARGFGLNERASLSTKHALALTNRGGATASDVLELANHVRHAVAAKFGVQLEIEPTLCGNFS